MKKFTKLFLAVAALFAVSCTTDVTEDLGVQLGEGQTAITLSLEASRTQLGEKAGEVYPLIWSAGDKISVNGVESNEAVIDGANGAVASFAVSASTPYCIAYPAAPTGQVLFAEKQAYTSNTTFGSGVATMYGYSEDGLGVQLNHLTGVLKIGVVGSAKLAMAQISTVDRAPIAGAFELDFTNGELKATTASKEVIEYSFGEGVQLSSEPTYIHVAVPAGVYDELYVTLYDVEGGVMYATVKANNEKPLAVGKVREFSSNIPYAATDQVFVVKDVATLKEFAAQAATLEKDVLFVADVDMSGEAWTPIEGYAKTVRGNGYAIKGLTAPLFGTTNASFKGLHIRDVALVSNGTLIMGALACTITATEEINPKVEHCSVSGVSITVDNKDLNPTEDQKFIYASMIGKMVGGIIDSCQSDATVTVNQLTATGNTITQTSYIGGLVGRLEPFTKSDASLICSEVHNSKSYGSVSYNDISNPSTHRCTSYVGGLIGVVINSNTKVVIHNCENHANVDIASNIKTLYLGGITSYAKGSTNFDSGSNCSNHGKITIKSGSYITTDLYLGGLYGLCNLFTANNCHNFGAIETEAGAKIKAFHIGGVLAQNTSESGTYSNDDCTNNAPIHYGASSPDKISAGFSLAGIISYSQGHLRRCTNNKEGTITITGNINTNGSRSTDASPKSGSYVIAGICGYKTVQTMNDCKNHADIIYSGTVTELHATNIGQLRIGGYQGYGSMDVNGATCDGKITLSGTFGCEVQTGGVLAFNYGNPGTITSDTDFEISGTFNGGLTVGGVVSVAYGTLSNYTYNGTINVTETAVINRVSRVAGCLGRAWGLATSASKAGSCSGHINNGTINVAGTHTGATPRIAGCVAAAQAGTATSTTTYYAHKLSNLTNNGTVTFSGTASGTNLYIGGCAALSTNTITTAKNNADVIFSGKHTSNNLYMSGVVADSGENATKLENYGNVTGTEGSHANSPRLTGCAGYVSSKVQGINQGNITWAGTGGATSLAGICFYGSAYDSTNGVEGDDTKGKITFSGSSTGNTHFGGIARDPWNANFSNCNNYGDMHISGHSRGSMYVGGVIYVGIAEGYTCSNCNNYGDINISATVGDEKNTGADFFVGGLAYACALNDNKKAKTYINCHNYGDINILPSCVVANSMRLGGLIANIESDILATFDSCSNHGNLNIAATSSDKTSGSYCVGGCFSTFDNNKQMIIKGGIKNTGNITISGENKKSSLVVGGVFGNIAADGITTGFEGKLINEGDINISGKSATSIRIGGVIGTMSYTMPIPMICTGDITVTGSGKNTADNRIGGVAASTSKKFSNCEYYGTITAVGYGPVVGMLTGSPRTADFNATDCKIGGKMRIESDPIDDKLITTDIDESNYMNYMYGPGAATDWTGSENFDNCSVLTAAPVVPFPVVPEATETPAPETGDTTTEQ